MTMKPEHIMTRELWELVEHFSPDSKTDHWGDPYQMDAALVFTLDAFRTFVGRPVHVHCGKEERGSGWHPWGRAADVHVEGMPVLDQYLAAERFNFPGIGVYPCWNNPGLHLDNRPLDTGEPGFRWGAFYTMEKGSRIQKYTSLDLAFLEKTIQHAGVKTWK